MRCPPGSPPFPSASIPGPFRAVTAVSCSGPTSSTVVLTLATPPRGGDKVSVSVSAASGGPTDLAGNHVADPHPKSVAAGKRADPRGRRGVTQKGALPSKPQPPHLAYRTD